MVRYIAKRLLLMIPTLLGILILNFTIVQFAPGGPVDQAVSRMTGEDPSGLSRFAGAGDDFGLGTGATSSRYAGSRGVDPELIAELKEQFGLDRPMHERFLRMIGSYLRFDLGMSYFHDRSVLGLILDRLPVSVSLGLWSTLLVYAISIPLGVAKAVRAGTAFDRWTSTVIIVGRAMPGFLLAVLLLVLFGGGNLWDLFPLRGLQSEAWADVSRLDCALDATCVADYFWHLALPLVSLTVGGFADPPLLSRPDERQPEDPPALVHAGLGLGTSAAQLHAESSTEARFLVLTTKNRASVLDSA